MRSPTSIARITGALYLVVIVCAGFAEGVVRTGLIVGGDPAATAANILASETLFRAGLAADVIAFMCDAAISVLLYLLLRPVGRRVAMLAAAFRLIAHPAIGSINLLNHIGALMVLTGGDTLAAFDPAELQALAYTLLEAHGMGYLIAGAFFGVHCLLLGFLIYRSGFLPRLLGTLMALAGTGYLIETFGNFMVPGHEAALALVVAIPAGIGEISLALWLLIKGVDETAITPTPGPAPSAG